MQALLNYFMVVYVDIVSPLIGVLIGGLMTGGFLLFSKRNERLAQLHRILSERRIEAYEEIVTEIRWLKMGVGAMNDGVYVKWPMVLVTIEEWDKWFGGFVVHSARVSHYIDDELSICLTDIQNYLHHLEHTVIEPGRSLSDEQWKGFLKGSGQFLYDDLKVLANRGMSIASKFYESGLYKRYKPSSRFVDTTMVMPEYVKSLNLFTRRDEILVSLHPTAKN